MVSTLLPEETATEQKQYYLVEEFLREKGIKKSVIRVNLENEKSLRVPERCGYVQTGSVRTTNEGPLVRFVKNLL